MTSDEDGMDGQTTGGRSTVAGSVYSMDEYRNKNSTNEKQHTPNGAKPTMVMKPTILLKGVPHHYTFNKIKSAIKRTQTVCFVENFQVLGHYASFQCSAKHMKNFVANAKSLQNEINQGLSIIRVNSKSCRFQNNCRNISCRFYHERGFGRKGLELYEVKQEVRDLRREIKSAAKVTTFNAAQTGKT
eukprot:UN27694